MIVTNLHKEPVALDTVIHRDLRLINDLNAIPRLAPFTSFIVSVSEFADAALNFPILFVRAAPVLAHEADGVARLLQEIWIGGKLAWQ